MASSDDDKRSKVISNVDRLILCTMLLTATYYSAYSSSSHSTNGKNRDRIANRDNGQPSHRKMSKNAISTTEPLIDVLLYEKKKKAQVLNIDNCVDSGHVDSLSRKHPVLNQHLSTDILSLWYGNPLPFYARSTVVSPAVVTFIDIRTKSKDKPRGAIIRYPDRSYPIYPAEKHGLKTIKGIQFLDRFTIMNKVKTKLEFYK